MYADECFCGAPICRFYVSAYYYICLRILLCPHTTSSICVSHHKKKSGFLGKRPKSAKVLEREGKDVC